MNDYQLQNYIASKNPFWADFLAREAKRRNVAINSTIDITNIAQSLQNGLSSGVKVIAYNPIIAPSESQLHSSRKMRDCFDYLFNND